MTDDDNRSKNIPIYNMRLAGYLMTQGFVLHKMESNTQDSHKNVYWFTDLPEVRKAMDYWLSTRKKD